MNIIPSYPVTGAVYCDAFCENLAIVREESNFTSGKTVSGDLWNITNIPTYLLAMVVQCLFWSSILVMIELKVFRKCKSNPDRVVKKMTLDEDVVKEAERT